MRRRSPRWERLAVSYNFIYKAINLTSEANIVIPSMLLQNGMRFMNGSRIFFLKNNPESLGKEPVESESQTKETEPVSGTVIQYMDRNGTCPGVIIQQIKARLHVRGSPLRFWKGEWALSCCSITPESWRRIYGKACVFLKYLSRFPSITVKSALRSSLIPPQTITPPLNIFFYVTQQSAKCL